MKDEVVAAQAASVIIAIGPTNSFLQMTFFVCYSIKIIGYFFLVFRLLLYVRGDRRRKICCEK